MQFTSIPFFIFLFAVVVAYYALPQKYRNYLLLAASYYFYFSIQPEYLVLLMISTLVNYLLGRGLEVYLRRKKVLLCVGLLFNLGILFFFKYFNFFGDQVNAIFSSLSLPCIEGGGLNNRVRCICSSIAGFMPFCHLLSFFLTLS